jgi:GntR family transcriptional regulator
MEERKSRSFLALRVDKRDPTPIYLQIANGLRTLIQNGILPEGKCLPAERILCGQYGFSRMTLRQAYDLLEREGLIECQRGKGTFVSTSRLEKQEQEMRSFTEEMKARGSRPSSFLLSFKQIKPSVVARDFFHLATEEPVYEIQRLRLRDGLPLALESVQIPCHLCPGLNRYDLSRHSLYKILEKKYGLELTRCVEEILALHPTSRQKKLLNLPPSAAVLVVHRKTYSRRDFPVELVTAAFRGDLYTAIVHSRRLPANRGR